MPSNSGSSTASSPRRASAEGPGLAEPAAGRLEGKVALITGAGSGIGRESALLFAREGAAIIVVDVTDAAGEETVDLVRRDGGKALYVHADISKDGDCAAMVGAAEEGFGRLDVLFNNAGIM